jgi:hypothetical protein
LVRFGEVWLPGVRSGKARPVKVRLGTVWSGLVPLLESRPDLARYVTARIGKVPRYMAGSRVAWSDKARCGSVPQWLDMARQVWTRYWLDWAPQFWSGHDESRYVRARRGKARFPYQRDRARQRGGDDRLPGKLRSSDVVSLRCLAGCPSRNPPIIVTFPILGGFTVFRHRASPLQVLPHGYNFVIAGLPQREVSCAGVLHQR